MAWLTYYFRSASDGYVFPVFGFAHISLLAFAFLGVLLMILNKKRLKETFMGTIFKRAMILLLSIQQIVLYVWYGFSGYFTIQESLPLYTCRLAIVFTIIALISGKKIFKTVGCYWGILGALLALLLPTDMDQFSFPHFTTVSFFVGHIALLWAAMYFLIVDGYKMNSASLKSMIYFSNSYLVLIYIFNVITKSNYCYVVGPPLAREFFAQAMSPIAYTITAFAAFNLVLILVHLVAMAIYKIMETRQKFILLYTLN